MLDLVGKPEDRVSHDTSHIVKLGFTVVHIFCPIFALNLCIHVDCGYSLEPKFMSLAKIRKLSRFTAVKIHGKN